MTIWGTALTPANAMEGLVVIFGIAATAIIGWTILTRPTLLRGLLSDAEGALTVSRLQLLIATLTALATLSSTTGHESTILAVLGLSNLGYLTGKLSPILSNILGGKQ